MRPREAGPPGHLRIGGAGASRSAVLNYNTRMKPAARILVIENDRERRKRLLSALGHGRGDAGFSVEQCDSLESGLHRLGARGVDAVLLDLVSPVGHGLEALKAVRLCAPLVPVVAITDDETSESALREGASEVVPGGQADILARAVSGAVERSRIEARLGDLELRLAQAQRMAAVGRLAAGVAHDFNNLLTVIIGYSELLQAGLPEGNPLRRSADAIRGASDRAASLTQQLLAFSRRQPSAPEVLDLNGVIGGIRRMLGRTIGEDVSIETALAQDLARVKADRGGVEQVLVSLAIDARAAMPRGGVLSIATRNVCSDISQELHASWPSRTSLVELSVTHEGCAVEEEQPGAWLSGTRETVEQLGGCLLVQKSVDSATAARVYLPAAQQAETEIEKGQQPRQAPPGSETILLVEDEAHVRRLLSDALEESGYTLIAASDGVDAALRSAAHTKTIDLLITDLVMPGMSGAELAAAVLERYPGARVLYMSGFADHPVVRECLSRPGVSFIAKPFTPVELACKVRDLMHERDGI
jgi:two-component system cell cycle sensor histidine kinase/response regulator CckA